jgi:DNA-binding transcriptional regulator YiaG
MATTDAITITTSFQTSDRKNMPLAFVEVRGVSNMKRPTVSATFPVSLLSLSLWEDC